MKKICIVIIIISVLFGSCKKGNELYDARNILATAKGYISIADITINGNKATSSYKVKQYCVYPDKLRVETIEPEYLKNKVVVHNDKRWKIYHPLINQTLIISKLMDSDEVILMGMIEKNIFLNDKTKLYDSVYEGIKCATMHIDIPNGNRFRKTAILYLDIKNGIPIAMELLDARGDLKVGIKYSHFTYNGNINEDLFNLK